MGAFNTQNGQSLQKQRTVTTATKRESIYWTEQTSTWEYLTPFSSLWAKTQHQLDIIAAHYRGGQHLFAGQRWFNVQFHLVSLPHMPVELRLWVRVCVPPVIFSLSGISLVDMRQSMRQMFTFPWIQWNVLFSTCLDQFEGSEPKNNRTKKNTHFRSGVIELFEPESSFMGPGS